MTERDWLPNIPQPTLMIDGLRKQKIDEYLKARRIRKLAKLPILGGLFKQPESKNKKLKWKWL